MKKRIMRFINSAIIIAAVTAFVACDDYLERAPLSNVTPADYLWSEADLAAYAVGRYSFPTHGGWGPGVFSYDNHTDNQASSGYASRWTPGEYRVPQSGGAWNFGAIRNCNYFIDVVMPRYEANEISGNPENVAHYIGEIYFMRAYEYFNKLESFGDFPILSTTLTDDKQQLIEASRRRPRNEVARFIIADLETAIGFLKDNPPGGTNRISKHAARLFLSRVALFEGSWLKYHKGTAHVPGGAGWPGQGKVADFSINIDQEIDFFLDKAMGAAELVADEVSLVENTFDDGYDSSGNPYFTMFGSLNLNGFPEVLLWRSYDASKGINHNVNHYVNRNGGNTGFTRGFVDNFLMDNGLPIYAAGSGYQGDDFLEDVKADRDSRLQLFMKIPGELRINDATNSDGSPILEGNPDITGLAETRYVTGYALKKGLSYLAQESEGSLGSTGSIVFRAAEAYLNYIEASYLRSGTINAKADAYWRAIRERAGVLPDYNVTIAATVMVEEAKNDFAAYSGGGLISDVTLYNIRRERRLELMAEGMRYFDLRRWRALDQLVANPYIIEGFKLWGPMKDWYLDDEGESILKEPGQGGTPNVSSSAESDYLRPYRINMSAQNLVRDGYRWAKAHYLEPIAIQHFQITASDPADLSTSVIYQNPYWPVSPNEGALE